MYLIRLYNDKAIKGKVRDSPTTPLTKEDILTIARDEFASEEYEQCEFSIHIHGVPAVIGTIHVEDNEVIFFAYTNIH